MIPRRQIVGTFLLAASWLVLSCGEPTQGSKANPDSASEPRQRVIHVMVSGGLTGVYKALGPEFEIQTGITLKTSYGASSGGAPDSIPERLRRSEYSDVVILSQNGLNALVAAGHVAPDSQRSLARSHIGMAIKQGASHLDISTTEKFIAVMRAANSIGYSASASGTYLSTKLLSNP